MDKTHIIEMIEFLDKYTKEIDDNDLVTRAKLTEIGIFLMKLCELIIGPYSVNSQK